MLRVVASTSGIKRTRRTRGRSPVTLCMPLRGPLSRAVIRMLKSRHHVRYHIWSCWRRNLSVADAFTEISDTAEGLCCRKTVARWYKRFEGHGADVCFDDQPRSGRPEKIPDVQPLLRDMDDDEERSTRTLGNQYNVSHTTIARMIKKLGFTYKLPSTKPYPLTDVQRQKRLENCQELLNKWNGDPNLPDNLVTCDETMLHLANTRRRRVWIRTPVTAAQFQAQRLKSQLRPATGPRAGTRASHMLCLFWHRGGLIHYELFNAKETLNAERYQQQLRTVADLLGMTPGGSVRKYLLHDNCTPHTARATLAVCEELGFDVLPHPPYSPDIAPTDFYIFRGFKTWYKKTSYATKQDVHASLNGFLQSKEPVVDFWRKGIDALPQRWRAVITANGDYPDYDNGEHLLPPQENV